MLRNINNFFNIIKAKRVKKTLDDTDMIPVGTRSYKNPSQYLDTAITVADLEAQIGTTGPQGPAGAVGPAGPKGDKGDTGPVGAAGLVFKSTWNPATSYVVGDVVFYNGSSYVCSNNVTSATPPDVDTANWDFLALQGLEGPQGPSTPYFYLSGTVTINTLADTMFGSILIPANTYTGTEALTVTSQYAKIPGHQGLPTYWINTANTLTGATLIATGRLSTPQRYGGMKRTFYLDGTNLYLFPELSIVLSDDLGSTSAGQTEPVDWTVDQYFIFAGRVDVAGQNLTLRGAKIF